MKYHKSVIGVSQKKPMYDCADLVASGYELKVAIYLDNPDLPAYIEEKEKGGREIKLVELKSDKDAKSVIDVWVK